MRRKIFSFWRPFWIIWKSRAKIRRLNGEIPLFTPRETVYQIWCFCPPDKYNAKNDATELINIHSGMVTKHFI